MSSMEIKQPKVSIIIPAYNCEDKISNAINSILKQTFTSYEIIIVNDGSTDQTVDVVSKFTSTYSNIKLFSSINMGPGHARNIGIKHSNGEYIYFMDSDDSIRPDTLESYLYLIEKNQSDLVVTSYKMNVIYEGNIISTRKVVWEDSYFSTNNEFLRNLYDMMNNQLMYVIWNKFYRARIIKENGIFFPDYKSCEDRLFNIRYFRFVNSCQVSSKIMYDYSFESNKSLTNKYLKNKFETFEEFYIQLLNLTENNLAGSSALFLKGTMSCIIPLHSADCPLNENEKIANINKIIKNTNVKRAVEQTSVDSILRKVFKMIFKTQSPRLIYTASYIMFKLNNVSPALIEKIKGNF